jgi:hypothetical protein
MGEFQNPILCFGFSSSESSSFIASNTTRNFLAYKESYRHNFFRLPRIQVIMEDFDDALDLLDDDGDGVVEMCLVEEEKKLKKNSGSNNKSGCCVVFLLLGSSLIIAGWCMSKMV